MPDPEQHPIEIIERKNGNGSKTIGYVLAGVATLCSLLYAIVRPLDQRLALLEKDLLRTERRLKEADVDLSGLLHSEVKRAKDAANLESDRTKARLTKIEVGRVPKLVETIGELKRIERMHLDHVATDADKWSRVWMFFELHGTPDTKHKTGQ